MAITLLDGRSAYPETSPENPLVEIFARSNPITANVPVEVIGSGKFIYDYLREKSLPNTGFRNINGNYTADSARMEQKYAQIQTFGGEWNIDLMKDTPAERTRQTEAYAKSAGANLQKYFFDGDSSAGQISGLAEICTDESQEEELGTGAGLAVLETTGANAQTLLDALEDATANVTGTLPESIDLNQSYEGLAWMMDLTMQQCLSKCIKLAGYEVTYLEAIQGSLFRLQTFAGIPILLIGKDYNNTRILGFDETSSDESKTDCGSIYLAHLSEVNGVHWICQGTELGGGMPDIMIETPARTRNQLNFVFNIGVGLVSKRSDSAYRVKGIRAATS